MAKSKAKKKNSQLIVRINDEERVRFIELCEELDTSAAREVRRFIRDFIKKQEAPSGDWLKPIKPVFDINDGAHHVSEEKAEKSHQEQ